MKLFNKIFSSFNKTSSINHEEIFIEENEEEPEKEYEENVATPLWQSIPSDENREKDKLNTTDYSNVVIYFKHGDIYDVVPDVNNYYLATHYNIDGTDYDISDVSSVNSIPLPTKEAPANESSISSPTYRLEYLLRIHAGFAKDDGNSALAYALMDKGTKMLRFSTISYLRHDYLREYYWLLDDDRIEEAQAFFKTIKANLPKPYSDKEYTKEIQHYNYAILKRNFPKDLPKSFSAYMRNYNKRDAKFQKYEELARSINITL